MMKTHLFSTAVSTSQSVDAKSLLKPFQKYFSALAFMLSSVGVFGQTSVQNFGTTDGSNTIITGNTTLIPNPTSGTTWSRGGNGGSVNLTKTSNPLGTTGDYVRAVAPTNASVVKFSPWVGYTGGTEFYTSFKVLFGDSSGGNTATSGVWSFNQGTGNMYSDPNDFASAQCFTRLLFTYGTGGTLALTYRAGGANTNTGLTQTSFSSGTLYTVEIVGNNKTSGTINYNYGGVAQTVAVQKFDLYVNGVLIGNDLAEAQLLANTSINAGTFIGVSSMSNVANIFVDDAVTYNAVPTAIGIQTYALTYDGNTSTSGTAPTGSSFASGDPVTAAGQGTLLKTGSTFTRWNSAADGTGTISVAAGSNFTMPANAVTLYAQWVLNTTPTISTTGTLSSINTIYGTASANTSFSVSGSALTDDITITAPAGFQVSKTTTPADFASSVTLPQTGGTVNATTIYVRIPSTTSAGTYSGNIALTSSGASSVNIATASSVVSKKALTIAGLTATDKIFDRTTSVTVSGTPSYVGLINGETFAVAGTVSYDFADFNVGTNKTLTQTGSYTAPSGNYTLTQPTLTASITRKTITITGAVAQNKPYDGNTTAVITGGTFVGLSAPDSYAVMGGGNFLPDANVGIAKTVQAVLTISGLGASNYFVDEPTGLKADITAVAPSISTSPISITVGGTYGLPGGNITSNSMGTFTYSLGMPSPAGSVTLTGNTLNGIAVGTALLTVNQAANGNYLADSKTVTVSVTTDVYNIGDYRSNSDGNWHSTAASNTANWQQYDGSSWTATAPSPPAPPTSGNTLGLKKVYIRNDITLVGTNTAKNIIIENGGALNTSTVTATFGKLLVKNGGVFNRQGGAIFDTEANGGILEVEDGGKMTFKQTNGNSRTNGIWAGKEKFHKDSNFEIIYSDNATLLLIQTIDDVSPFTDGSSTAIFGNVIVNCGTGSVQLIPADFGTPASPKQLTHQDFIFRSNSDNKNFATGAFNTIIGRNLVMENGYNQNVILANTAVNVGLLVKGNVVNNSSKSLTLINNATGTANVAVEGNLELNNSAILSYSGTNGGISNLNLTGDLKVGATAQLIANNATNATLNFTGTGDGSAGNLTQTVDVANQSTASNIVFNVNSGSYVKLVNQNLSQGTNSKFNVLTGGTLDFGFDGANGAGANALNIVGNSGGQTFTATTGSTLKITSPDGITNSANLGNVQVAVAGRTFDVGATYHYIGKENQATGDGLQKGASNKKIIVELDQDNLEFKSNNGIIRFNNPNTATGLNFRGLEIRRGTVISDNNGNRFEDSSVTGEKGNLKMTGGIFKLFAKDIQPSLTGVYELLAPSKIDFALTDVANTQSIRSGPDYIYPAIDVSGKSVTHTSGDNINLKSAGTFTVKAGGLFSSQSSTGQIISNDVNLKASLIIENNGTFATQREKGFYGPVDGLNPSPSVRDNIVLSFLPNSTVDYSRLGDQAITSQNLGVNPNQYNYQNLNISGSGIKTTAAGIMTVNRIAKLTSAPAELLVPTPANELTPNVFYALGGIDNTNGTTGLFHLANDAQLMQNVAAPDNSKAKIQVDRDAKIPVSTFNQYIYWSSPVDSQNYKAIFGGNTTALYYNEGTDKFLTSTGANIAGRALAVKNPTSTPGTLTAQFIGKPFVGDLPYTPAFTDVAHGYNLVGNPYPSNLNLDELYTNSTNIESTFQFWDNTSNVQQTQMGSTYQGYSYAKYNAVSGIGLPSPGTGSGASNNVSKVPNNILKVAQGFIVRATSNIAKINFRNTDRIIAQTASQFFGRNASDSINNRYYLEMVTPADLRISNAIVYFETGNNEFSVDDSKLSTDASDALFTNAGDEKVVINGRSTFTNTDVLKVGNKFFVAGSYQIRLGKKEGIFENGQNIYLKDVQTGIITNLSEGSYSFTANAGENTGRFEIIYKPETVLATNQIENDDLIVFRKDEYFVIRSAKGIIEEVEVLDASGKLIITVNTNNKEVNIDNSAIPSGVYILKIKRNEQIISKKIIR